MTLQEKIGQMIQVDLSWKQDVKGLMRNGQIGSLLSIREPDVINEYQRIAVEESRLGIPVLVGNDIIHGYRSIFPIPLALASSWDTSLIEEVAQATISEALATGTTVNFSPMVDISRDPRWGRIAEGAGEDPHLTSSIGQAWTRGFQTFQDKKGRSAAACVKHFAAYGAAESGKDYNTTDMSERRLREEYLPPYQAAIDAGVKSIMTSFNDFNGVPATANTFLLRQILRKEWGYEGVVFSDYDSIGELVLHGFARDHKEAALRSILAGVDIDMMGDAYHFHLADLVQEGQVSEAMIDEAVLRILRLKYDLGLFTAPYIDENNIESTLFQPDTLLLAEKAVANSTILLKNDESLLPLRTSGKTIALIGPMIDEQQSLLGCWSFDGDPNGVATLADTLQINLPHDTKLLIEKGCQISGAETDFTKVVDIATQADLVILAVGESDTMSGEAHSRAFLGLPGSQQDLVNAIALTGKPIIAIVFAGRPLVLTQLEKKASALIMAWHGGTRASQGLCDILLGRVNPSAKTTTSFPRSEGQIPVYYAHKSTGRPIESSGTLQFNQAHKSSYLDESNTPLYPFGFGLSYTTFDYSDIEITPKIVSPEETLVISAIIKNKGNMEGAEIVQLYTRDLVGSVTRPVKELKDFQKVTLLPGESRRVIFRLPVNQLTFLDQELHSIIEPGLFKVWIGPNSSEGLEACFEVS